MLEGLGLKEQNKWYMVEIKSYIYRKEQESWATSFPQQLELGPILSIVPPFKEHHTAHTLYLWISKIMSRPLIGLSLLVQPIISVPRWDN